jgi:hypothetical protein
MGCTTTETFETPEYPRYVQLTNGHYGEPMYSINTPEKQAMYECYYRFCDTANFDLPKRTATAVKIEPPKYAVFWEEIFWK